MEHLSVREIQPSDVPHIMAYWKNASPEFLYGMGADRSLFPDFTQWEQMLLEQIRIPYAEKTSYCLIWIYNNRPVGHTNVNKIVFGQEAFMHLHLWEHDLRRTGIGIQMLQPAIPYFFKNLELEILYCEPYALNPAPSQTLKKLGFELLKEYITVPGAINFEQPVKCWQLGKEKVSTWTSAAGAT